MTVQRRNDQNVELLSADFQRRHENAFAWVNAGSAVALLPGIRGSWTMYSYDEDGHVYDHSGQGRTLWNEHTVFGHSSLASWADFDGVNAYLSRSDEPGLDVIGNEAVVSAGYQGLTLGGWFKPDSVAVANQVLMSKWDVANNDRSYYLNLLLDQANFAVSTDGTVVVQVNSGANVVTTSAWYFIVGRFEPSGDMDIFIDDNISTLAVGVPATINDSATSFQISGYDTTNMLYNGKAALCWMCANLLTNGQVLSIYHQTRAMFGK